MTYFDVPATHKSLLDTVCNNVEYGSTLFTDEYRAYDSFGRTWIHTSERKPFGEGICKRHRTRE
jgi:hypothetical protein